MQPFVPMLLFAFVTSITPGPNNTLIMMVSANWGFRASLPVFFGIVGGFLLMLFAVGLGIGEIFSLWPSFHILLKWICFAWLLVLAWKIARAGRPTTSENVSRPPSFLQIVAFQWVNPKAWMMSVGAIALFVPVGTAQTAPVLRVLLAFIMAGAPCVLMWSLFGAGISRFLTSSRRVMVFNVSMAILLVLSMIPTLF